MLFLWQVDDRIGTLSALFSGEANFPFVVDIKSKARVVQYVLQHQLTPVTLHLLLALQGGSQLVGLIGDLLVERL
ncbi:hypothetical protein D3C72_1656180 [compost metagenome]